MQGISFSSHQTPCASSFVVDLVPSSTQAAAEGSFNSLVMGALDTSSTRLDSQESWGDRVVKVLTSPFDAVFGAIWLGSTIYHTVNLFSGANESSCDTDEKVAQLHKEAFKNGVAFLGNAANVTTWLEGVKIVSLDSLFLSVCQNLGIGISLTLGWINLMNSATIIGECNAGLENSSLSSQEKDILCHKKAAAIINFITQLCYIFWAILSLIALCFSVLFPPILLFSLLSLGLIGSVVGFVYNMYASGIAQINLEPPAYLRA